MKLIFATQNKNKVVEVAAIFEGTNIELVTLAAYPEIPEPPETQDTFAGNALQKARFVYGQTGLPCIADDSGLEVDVLEGAPGVHSKRFSAAATGPANNALLLQKLTGINERTSRFRCTIALVYETFAKTAEGRCEGSIGVAERGHNGFGYDPLFLPDESSPLTMAELSMADKNAISHRGRAFRQLPGLLDDLSDYLEE
ncbi:MAG: RdgB/HAM1 family non-canonical purine NTP pyrophosphatase [Proteobacteria bacterium]|jgi:XTP/dITP diphosphohydrolase|nr:RdgB/HAM1 family non-canonical purine NTP pyrophosphatase [Pseudomonadota bacterium]